MPQDLRSKQQDSIAKVLLSILFLGGLGVLAWVVERGGKGLQLTNLTVFDIVLIGFATFRLGRMVSYDRIMDPVRAPFTKVVADSSGEGKTIAPRGTGFRQSIGQLISCPICVGTWVAAFLVLMMLIAPDGTRIFLYILGAVALAELLNSLTEALCWAGRSGRSMSGLAIQQRLNLMKDSPPDTSHSHKVSLEESEITRGIEE